MREFIKNIIFLLTILLSLLGGGCKQQLNLFKVSDEIYKKQVLTFGDNMFLKGLHVYREKSKILERIKFSSANDTIFALEILGIQGDLYITYWNKTDTISYSINSGEPEFMDHTLFTRYMMKLVSEWDIVQIKKEEEKTSPQFPDDPIYATRIIIHNNKYKIECISFSDFYDIKRDG